jgi:hypothetical protein
MKVTGQRSVRFTDMWDDQPHQPQASRAMGIGTVGLRGAATAGVGMGPAFACWSLSAVLQWLHRLKGREAVWTAAMITRSQVSHVSAPDPIAPFKFEEPVSPPLLMKPSQHSHEGAGNGILQHCP